MMADYISKQAVLDALEKERDYLLKNGKTGAEHILVHHALNVVDEIPPADVRPVGWIPCSERLPVVTYDYLGNWKSEGVLLYFADGHYDIGHFNPVGVFETFDGEGDAVYAGSPRPEDEEVIAWMPLPEPYKGGDAE